MKALLTVLTLVAFLSIGSVWAEVILLKSGDRITGSIKSYKDGQYEIETAYGSLTIPSKDIVEISMDSTLVPGKRYRAFPEVGEMVAVEGGAFYVDIHEVTNEQYSVFVAATGHRVPKLERGPLSGLVGWATIGVLSMVGDKDPEKWHSYRGPPNYETYPVVGVSWEDAAAYCKWAGKRLPTGAEWQYACEGAEQRWWPWGSDPGPGTGNMRTGVDGFQRMAPVGSFPAGATPEGHLDMAGNVWEWVSDESQNPSSAIRGAGWHSGSNRESFCTGQQKLDPETRRDDVGFRCMKPGSE